MPWSVKQDDRCPADEPWGVVKDDDNELEGCHPSEEAAQKQQAALYANERSQDITEAVASKEPDSTPAEEGRSMPPMIPRPPRDNLVRAINQPMELVADEEDPAGMPILEGRLVYDEWTEINSLWEGRFMERIAHGAFTKSFTENRSRMRLLFQHGQDPQIGDKVLAPIDELGEDEQGGFYRGRLLDTSYNRDLLPGLEKGLYGSSFRFNVTGEDFKRNAKPSIYNPEGLPERTVIQAEVMEMGPVTFPAYVGSTAGVRSLTDQFLARDERLRALLTNSALPSEEPASSTPDTGSRTDYPPISREAFLEKISG